MTYATKPTVAGTVAANASIGGNNFHYFSVTSLVQSWITTPASNFGMELQASGTTNIAIDSKENTNTSHPAVLEIDLSGRTGRSRWCYRRYWPATSWPAGARGATGATGAAGPAGGLTLPYSGSAAVDQPVMELFNTSSGDGLAGFGGASVDVPYATGGSGIVGAGGNGANDAQTITWGGTGVFGQGGALIGARGGGETGGAFQGGSCPSDALPTCGGYGVEALGGYGGEGTPQASGLGIYPPDHPRPPHLLATWK